MSIVTVSIDLLSKKCELVDAKDSLILVSEKKFRQMEDDLCTANHQLRLQDFEIENLIKQNKQLTDKIAECEMFFGMFLCLNLTFISQLSQIGLPRFRHPLPSEGASTCNNEEEKTGTWTTRRSSKQPKHGAR